MKLRRDNVGKNKPIQIAVMSASGSNQEEEIKEIFNSTFSNCKVINRVEFNAQVETIYEIASPYINDNKVQESFFEKLDSLFEDLKDYMPSFVKFAREDSR